MNNIIHTIRHTARAATMLLLALLTAQTAWADAISYLDATGAQQSCTNYTTVESNSTDWNNAWYVVSSNTTIADRITVSGTVNLILVDGATLTASKGITVGSDATLNIYAQTDDEATMGALVASGANDNQQYNAGIGGVDNTAAGTITINGGKINATGMVGAGIGSGGQSGATVGTITINGGIVTAQDGSGYGAGIGGGGIQGKAGTINLNGGIINAAGIGSGYMGGDCSITVNISDGVKKIVATPVLGGACIGKGASASGTVTVNFISGGNIVTGDAKDAVFYDTGEGSERQIRTSVSSHSINMSDDLKANITLNTEYALEGETITLTLGAAVDASTLKVNDGTSNLTLTDAGNRNYTFTMPAGNVTVTATLLQTYSVNLPANMEVVGATNAADANGKYITGTTVTFKASFPYAASDVSDGTNTLTAEDGVYSVTVADADIIVTATFGRSSTIDLTDASDDFAAINNDVLTGTTSHTVTIADGANITLNNATISGSIICEGSATITLVGTNNVSGATNKAGIQIGGSGTTLTIRGDGSLTANGGAQSAGIGLSRAWNPDDNVIGGDIVIEGGNITANGGSQWGAGIGTGVIYGNGSAKTARIGNITIKGGTVKAMGGTSADGIGTGYTYSPCTNAIGTVTIYDGINMVDASSIKDFGSVVYMHDENNVTASKTDYFTIAEDGDRRVITPKDDTDYTITIADDIEHGTLTGAATAKYMETVNITVTPDLGYWLSRLVVKDADNNDVATTGNTFQMPKGNVTVSAVFEQGTHGTTEFAWGYFGQDGFVTEATIYDGVTTVNLQQGQSYQILEYDEYDDYRKFLLDNSTYAATIPYSGGTGTFPEYGNGTNFNLNDESGFYDITMTDVGNGKWSVSILKTVAVMDAVPDQTYTGSEITPEPIVLAGSLTLTKGTDYEYSYSDNTNVGTATVTVTFMGDYTSLGSVNKTFTIIKATPTVTVPTPVENLVYTGSPQALVTAGTTDFGTLLYSTDGENYSTDIPTATDAGTYNVYYKLEASDNWNAVDAQTVEVTIAYYNASLADIVDNTDVISNLITNYGSKANVTLSGRTLYKDGKWNTLCLPFSLSAAQIAANANFAGATLMTMDVTEKNGFDVEDGTLYLWFKTATEIEAGMPYLVKWDKAADYDNNPSVYDIVSPVFEGVTVSNSTAQTVESKTAGLETVQMVGTYSPVSVTADDKSILFLGDANTLYYSSTDRQIRSCRSYFSVPYIRGHAGAKARAFALSFDGEETTGILEVSANSNEVKDDVWYSLDGVRLSGKPTQHGMYINKGKKIVVK